MFYIELSKSFGAAMLFKAPDHFLITVLILMISFYSFKKLEAIERDVYGGQVKHSFGRGFMLLTMSGVTLLVLYLTFMFTIE